MTHTNINEKISFDTQEREGFGIIIAGILVALGALLFVGISTAHGQAAAPSRDNGTASDTVFTTLLLSTEEVPPTTSTMSGRGHFVQSQSRTGSAMHYQLIVQNGENIIGAHLHCGPRGVNGPVVVDLLRGEKHTSVHGELASGVITLQDILPAGATCAPNIRTIAHLAQAMREGKVYVNVHTTQYPNGEIRGQVHMQMPHGWNYNTLATSTPPHIGTPEGYNVIPGGTHVTAPGLEIHEISANQAGTSRFIISISHDLLRRIGDLLPNIWQMIQPLLNR